MAGRDLFADNPSLNLTKPAIASGGRDLFAQPQEASQEGFSIAETVSNIPSSAVQFGKDIIEPILSPVETAKSLQSLGQGLVEKALPSEIHGFDFARK